MSDELLPYYDRELNALRRLAGEFATRTQRSPAGCASRPMWWTTRMSPACSKGSPSSPLVFTTA
jgi:hypothetical protein